MKNRFAKIMGIFFSIIICFAAVGFAIPKEGISLDIGKYSFKITGFRGLAADAVADRANNYEIIDNGDGTAWIRAYIGEETEIVIPSVIDGLTVTKIGPYAFSDCVAMTNVVIPDTVTEIGDFAFYQNIRLSQLTLPDSVAHVGYCAFDYTPWQETLINMSAGPFVTIADNLIRFKGSGEAVIPSNVRTLGSSVFRDADVTRVVIPEGVTCIPAYTFSYHSSLTGVVLPSTLEEIGKGAFRGCENLEKINLNNVEVIGQSAFAYCEKLKSVDVSSAVEVGNSAFEDCSSISEVTFGSDAVKISYNAFGGCTSISSVSIPHKDSEIHNSAFSECTNLINVDFSKDIALVSGNAFARTPWMENNKGFCIVDDTLLFYSGDESELTIPSGVKVINEYAIADNNYLKKITLPDSVIEIGEYAFFCCRELTEVIIPESVVEIGEYAFYSCRELTEVIIPESVRRIEDSAFMYCYKLETLDIPENIKHIGDRAFSGTPWFEGLSDDYVIFNNILLKCNRIDTEIVVPDGVTWICSEAFDEYKEFRTVDPDSWDYYTYAQNVTSIHMPDTVTRFGSFDGFSLLKEITLPASLVELSDRAFSDCSSLESIVIPDCVTKIGSSAFSGCSALKNVTLPKNLRVIGERAFSFSGLENIIMYDKVTQVGTYAFVYTNLLGGNVYYYGSVKSWDAITFEGPNYEFLNSNIHYITPVKEAASEDVSFTVNGKEVEPEAVELVMVKTANNDSLIDAIGADSGDCFTYDLSLRDKSGNAVSIDKGTINCLIPFSGGATYENRSSFEFELYHFSDGANKEQVAFSVEKDGIRFAADSFSPYILVCKKIDPTTICNITYDANGGSNAPEPQVKKHDIDLALDTAVPTRDGYSFLGWNTEPNGSGTSYAPGEVYSLNADLMLYAQWSIRLPGDVNSDGKVSMMDSTILRRWLAGWSGVTINESNADVSGDGEVTMMDSIILRRYLANWSGVELK